MSPGFRGYIILSAVAMLVIFVYVPWSAREWVLDRGYTGPATAVGYAPVWAPPPNASIDWGRWWLTLGAAVIVVSAAGLVIRPLRRVLHGLDGEAQREIRVIIVVLGGLVALVVLLSLFTTRTGN